MYGRGMNAGEEAEVGRIRVMEVRFGSPQMLGLTHMAL